MNAGSDTSDAQRALALRPLNCELFLSEASARIPFRFGNTTLRRGVVCTARVELATVRGPAVGYSADLLVPGWFRKEPGRTPAQDAQGLAASAELAGRALNESKREDSVFGHWRRIWNERVEAVAEDAPDRLERGFGVALIERAMIDAACRVAGVSVFEALCTNLLGFEPAAIHAELSGWSFPSRLPARLPRTIAVRHTVGLLDPLTRDDPDALARADGLPRSLDEELARYGLTHFKIKLRGERVLDTLRLIAVARVLRERCEDPLCTLDGNEQFGSLGAVAELLSSLRRDADGAWLAERIAYIEQPLPRSLTFDPRANAALEEVRRHAPLLIDEADGSLRDFERAFALGHRGVSVKNCKGVFRALLHRGLCERWGDGAFQSGEDLTNLGVLALQQDLATMAVLELSHVERNGHHYFRGLAHLPAAEVAEALHAHGDLYEPLGETATLKIRSGKLSIGSLDCPGYANSVAIQVDQRTPLARWRFE